MNNSGFLSSFFFFVCVSLALMENKLATVLGCLPETIVTSGAFFPLVICSFVDKDCGEVKQCVLKVCCFLVLRYE